MSSTAEEMIAYGEANIHERAAVPKEVHFVDAVPLTAVGKIFKPELRNTLIQQQISAELAELLDEPLMVDVAIDKKFGQCVTVTSPAGTHTTISNALGDYAFKLVLRKT